MPNIQDHVREVGTLTLQERPFDELDGLVLSQIVYMPMEGLLNRGQAATIIDLWDFLKEKYPDAFSDPFQRKRYHLTQECAATKRYGRFLIHDYLNSIDKAREMQFSACSFDMPMGRVCVAFRGTDWSITGWKEDLNMSFMTVPAQLEAVEYVQRIAARNGDAILLCGHSKGGNLAVYAGACANGPTQERVQRIYSYDGPGVDEKTLGGLGYELVHERIQSYIPQSSVVGMLLCYHPVYTVVRSNSMGILQHDAMTWQVKNNEFETFEDVDASGKLTDETLHRWLAEMSYDDRRLLVNTLYQVVDAAQAETIDGLVEEWRESAGRILEAIRELNPEVRKNVWRMLVSLFNTGAASAIHALLPHALHGGKEEKHSYEG